jgi:hypothetical protein
MPCIESTRPLRFVSSTATVEEGCDKPMDASIASKAKIRILNLYMTTPRHGLFQESGPH